MLRLSCCKNLLPAAGLLLACVVFAGCQAERPIVSPVEPEWSYHDGHERLSNNDAWDRMIPASALLRYNESTLASVEDTTAK